VKAKVCGLTRASDVPMVLAAGADLVGFLQHPASPRHCPDPGLARLAGARAVLVVVAEELEPILDWLGQCPAQWVQPYLPAAERAQALARLRAMGVRVLLPWPDEPGQEPLPADLYLWETSPAQTGRLGGSGQGHAMLHPPPGPFLLAGGLSGPVLAKRFAALDESARAACRGFDAASRLEAGGPGKDRTRVVDFVTSAHSLQPHSRSTP
jgi:phosphoribosylanthranilate isomerase